MIIPNLNEMDVEYWFRQVRNNKLFKSDWTQTIDSPLTESKKTEWATYRQQLRDITNGLTTVEEVDAVVFPTKPTE